MIIIPIATPYDTPVPPVKPSVGNNSTRVFFITARGVIFNACPDAENLKHPRGRSTEQNNSQDDDSKYSCP